jgi:hypothetical protein
VQLSRPLLASLAALAAAGAALPHWLSGWMAQIALEDRWAALEHELGGTALPSEYHLGVYDSRFRFATDLPGGDGLRLQGRVEHGVLAARLRAEAVMQRGEVQRGRLSGTLDVHLGPLADQRRLDAHWEVPELVLTDPERGLDYRVEGGSLAISVRGPQLTADADLDALAVQTAQGGQLQAEDLTLEAQATATGPWLARRVEAAELHAELSVPRAHLRRPPLVGALDPLHAHLTAQLTPSGEGGAIRAELDVRGEGFTSRALPYLRLTHIALDGRARLTRQHEGASRLTQRLAAESNYGPLTWCSLGEWPGAATGQATWRQGLTAPKGVLALIRHLAEPAVVAALDRALRDARDLCPTVDTVAATP